MKVLVDSHVFIWALTTPERLSPKAHRTLNGSDELFFSLVSLWEISIKIKLGRFNVLGSSVAYIREEMDAFGLTLLPITYAHVLALEQLPHHHSDPFDRLLLAQAAAEAMPILTHDRLFKPYGLPTIW